MGLRIGDLKDLVHHIFEIDAYASKMGDDKNIVTLSFTVGDKNPADDLMRFLEGGYSFILDSDVTAGEQSDGAYRVFVELERDRSANENIMEIIDGVSKLASVDNFKFRYYKGFKSFKVSMENLDREVPLDPDNYGITVSESNLNNYKNFFTNSYLEDIVMEDTTLSIKKAYADTLAFEVLDFGDTNKVVTQITETFDVLNSYPELMFLTKYMGDYNISKYGDKLVFENKNKSLVLKKDIIMFELQKEHLALLIPGNKNVDAWHAALVDILPKYGITTERRMAHFISQCAHESNNFRSLKENLNYSEKALNAVFGRYFGAAPKRNAAEYARNPEMIANYVYQDEFRSARGQLGNTQTGDGWRFCGRGLKQLTGRNNYERFGKTIGMSADDAATYVATEKGAVESACWFWGANNLNSIADTDDVTKMTKKINGGNIGLADRQSRYKKAMEVFGNPVSIVEDDGEDDIDVDDIGVLRKGCKGEGVKMMQEALGVGADGAFGPGTERALKAWQTANDLKADGIAGPRTLEKLLG